MQRGGSVTQVKNQLAKTELSAHLSNFVELHKGHDFFVAGFSNSPSRINIVRGCK